VKQFFLAGLECDFMDDLHVSTDDIDKESDHTEHLEQLWQQGEATPHVRLIW